MKRILFIPVLGLSMAAMAQQKVITQATINTTTNVIAPEEEDVQNIQNTGSNFRMFQNFGDGETKSTTWLKNDMIKTVIKSDMGRTTIIRNNGLKVTTTLMEMMGNKTGFYVSDEDQAEMKRKRDSMMANHQPGDSGSVRTMPANTPTNVDISYSEETKIIAGYVCKKAYVITTRLLGFRDTTVVWYTPEFKLQNVSSTGGLSGFGNMGAVNGLDKVDGFVMGYEMKMRRNRRMEVEVKKIELGKEISDKEFDISKDFEVKSLKEMGGNMNIGGQGGFQIRIGGH